MFTRDPGAPFDTPNGVIGRQGRNELTLSFRPDSTPTCIDSYILGMLAAVASFSMNSRGNFVTAGVVAGFFGHG